MKKALLTLAIAFLGAVTGFAQDETVMQPTHVVGKRINADGEVTRVFVSDFSYGNDGKLTRFEFPEYAISASYFYSGDYLTQEWITHAGGYPIYYEDNRYTYEDGRLKTVSHIMDQMMPSLFYVYSYFDDGRLERIDKREDDEEVAHEHWLYTYENDGKTVVKSYCTSYIVSLGMLLRERTTSHYDDNYTLLDELVEKYNASSELTSTEKTDYTYTESGQVEECATQVLDDGQWVNSSVKRYAYDEEDRVTETLEGSWDAENNSWDFTKKTTYETSADGQTYTVSFLKKSEGEWIWDVYDNYSSQTVMFGSYLKAQQSALGYYAFDLEHGHAYVNQFEITLELTKMPTYLDAEETEERPIAVFPNPGRDALTVTAPMENAVVRIYDLRGRLVLAKPFDFQTDIHTGDWATGIYLWEVWNGIGKAASGKWVKQ